MVPKQSVSYQQGRTSTMSDDSETLKKELHSVKSKAVAKIKALQEKINNLEAHAASLESQLEKQRSPPESASSEEGERFVKVDRLESAAGDLEAREAALGLREQELDRREAELAAREEKALRAQAESVGSADADEQASAWHGSLLQELRAMSENLSQIEFACDATGV